MKLRPRRALSQWYGPVTFHGDRAASGLLRNAMTAPQEPLRLSHEFHVYPARLPPSLVRTIVATVASGETVLDPFCGSGTTLVEARVRGCRAIGRDINPLAVRLARLKTSMWSPARLSALRRAASVTVTRARSILDARAASHPPHFARHDFAPHLVWELASLRDAASGQEESEALLLCFSSLLVKLSLRRSATSRETVAKSIPAGRALKLFIERAGELADRLGAFSRALPAKAPEADVAEGDARMLTGIPDHSVDLVLTSPPYVGQYSYADATEISRAWLQLGQPRGEVGARFGGRIGAYRKDLESALKAMRRVLKPGGRLFVVIGGVEPEKLAGSSGFRFVASASQARPQGRKEHLVLLR